MKNAIELCDITVQSTRYDGDDWRQLISKILKKTHNALRQQTACPESFDSSSINLEKLKELALSQLDYLVQVEQKLWRDFTTDALMRKDVPLDLGPYARQVLLRN